MRGRARGSGATAAGLHPSSSSSSRSLLPLLLLLLALPFVAAVAPLHHLVARGDANNLGRPIAQAGARFIAMPHSSGSGGGGVDFSHVLESRFA